MTRSGYVYYGRKLPRQPAEDPRKHLDARMNELLDLLYTIPMVSAASAEPDQPAHGDGSEAVALFSSRDPDRPPAQTLHTPDLNLVPIIARGRGLKQDLPWSAPSSIAIRPLRQNAG